MTPEPPPAIFLMGPTATGKTDLAVELVRRLPVEIVSVDSAMVYRQMDIGTAKPGPEILATAPHRLIDILDPGERYSAARFRTDALREMAEITAAGRIPLLAGGTMLYFSALLRGLSPLPEADPEVRRRIDEEAERLGWEAMHARLARLDPEAAARIHPNDPQRLQRALEVCELTGHPLSELQGRAAGPVPLPYRPVTLALLPASRDELRERIAHRFVAMLGAGFLEEVEALYGRGDLGIDLPSIRCVGYRQAWQHLQGSITREEMAEKAITATRQLAKRQLTWLRREQTAVPFTAEDPKIVYKVLKFLSLNAING